MLDHRLWIAMDSKEIWAIDEATEQVTGWELPAQVNTLLRTDDKRLLAASTSSEGERTLWERHGEGWRRVRSWRQKDGIRWMALAADRGQIVLAESNRVRVIERDGREREVTLSMTLPVSSRSSVAMTSGALYVGINRGEFGGGLWRVDLSTGNTTEVRGSGVQPPPTDDPICGPGLHHECAPVTAVVADPTRSGCVLASVGISHMSLSDGAVHRVCGESIERIWYERLRECDRRNSGIGPHCDSGSVPVWGLLPAPGGFWASTASGLVRHEAGHADQVWTSLTAETRGGIMQSRQFPGLRLVWREHQTAISVGHAMLVPTD